jgi:hypothetical protein
VCFFYLPSRLKVYVYDDDDDLMKKSS